MSKTNITLPINRVEGDLEISVDITDNKVVGAQVAGTMFRGFERMMTGRGLLDGLVITPRICGICSTSHLYAAALALDDLHQLKVCDNAVRMRNLAHIAEHLQSDMRHVLLMFAVDFAHKDYADRSFFAEAKRCYTPLRGESAISVVKATRQILEIVAIIGGQWPHSSFMVPGGMVSAPSSADLRKCRLILDDFSEWYETQILGGPLAEFQKLRSADELSAWCADPAHTKGDLARIIRIAEELHLDSGSGVHNFISGGSLPLPADETTSERSHLCLPGYWRNGGISQLDVAQISEQLTSSFYHQNLEVSGSIHQNKTVPAADKEQAYSWVKAPRYADKPAETSPLGELLCNGHPLLSSWVAEKGVSPLARELARLLRPAELIPAALRWIKQTDPRAGYYAEPEPRAYGRGTGIVQASRGMLGHWLNVHDGVIENYQMITPTSWNASPRDDRDRAGPMEQALLGANVLDPENPRELGHIVRSFDPCLVCAVHSLHKNGRNTLRLGA
jgi:hydrogenase large subunit